MPFSTMVFPLRGIGLVSLHGRVDADDLLGAMTSLVGMETWEAGFDTLWDARRIEELHVTPEDADTLVDASFEMVSAFGPGRAAIVVPREVDFLFTEMLLHRTQNEHRPRRTFRTMEDALKWLDLNPHLSVLVNTSFEPERNTS